MPPCICSAAPVAETVVPAAAGIDSQSLATLDVQHALADDVARQ